MARDDEEACNDRETGLSTELISSERTRGGMVITGGWDMVSDGQETASDLITLDEDNNDGGDLGWGEEGGEGSSSSGLGSLEEQTLSLDSWLSSSSSSMSPMLVTLYDRSCSSYLQEEKKLGIILSSTTHQNISYPDSVIRQLSDPGTAPALACSGLLRQVWMSNFPDSEVMMGCSFWVANVYT